MSKHRCMARTVALLGRAVILKLTQKQLFFLCLMLICIGFAVVFVLPDVLRVFF